MSQDAETAHADQTVLIIGGGQAGAQCAASLRREGWLGHIILAGDEPHPPYQRPPLSKAYLSGEIKMDRLWLQTPETWAEQAVELRTGLTADSIDPANRTARFTDGTVIDWNYLVLATGARVRELPVPGSDLTGVRYLRNIADVDALKADFSPGKRIAVIGGGYIGLEAASVASKLGANTVVIEAMDRLLARVAHPLLSQAMLDLHQSKGVDIRLGTGVARLEGTPDGVNRLVLSDGSAIDCDSVLVGIGVVPDQDLAAHAGLAVGNGIEVDETCRTSHEAIFAIGDCAEAPNAVFGRRMRLESVPNAIEQGKRAAAAICGKPAPKPETPWFWSDQFDVKLQSAGLIEGADQSVVRGTPGALPLSIFHFSDGRLIAADALNDPPSFMAAKMMIATGAKPDPEALANPDIPVRDTMKAAQKADA